MNVLVLGNIPSPITSVVRAYDCRVFKDDGLIDVEYLHSHLVDFTVSYRYRHIVRKPVIDYLRGRIINLHISCLPWNRGADPNLWSFLEDTPKGVTIHYMDEGLDTGDIVAQKEVSFELEGETLATTYKKLNEEILALFREHWPLIMRGEVQGRKQPPGGSFHRTKDKDRFTHLLADKGWDTPVVELVGKALINSKTRRADL